MFSLCFSTAAAVRTTRVEGPGIEALEGYCAAMG
jgi:hypothetical protein